MCNICGQPSYVSCGCYNPPAPTSSCGGNDCGCPVELDFSCVFYHKDNNAVSQLDELRLPNGTNLEIITEVINERLKQTKFDSTGLSYLRSNYTINNLQQFTQAVDSSLSSLSGVVDALSNSGTTSLTANDSNSISFITSGVANHTITANIKVSATDGNTLSVITDGLYVSPQTLNVNYTDKTISISNGNAINLSSLLPSSQYLGEIVSDPVAAISGNYWYNTTQNKLKIKIATTIKEILIA